MPVRVSVHQPNFLPWVKLLDKILASDVYVAYDTVQYTKREFHSRQKVKLPTGADWLSVPVVHPGHQNIEAIRIDDHLPWRRKHLGILAQHYKRAKYFEEVYALVEDAYAPGHEYLVDLSMDLITAFCAYLGARPRLLRASELIHEGDNTERLIDLVRNAGGDVHLTSTYDSDRAYIDWPRLQEAGLGIASQEFTHPVYDQLWGEFVPHLSALDMLFCCGPQTADILAAQRRIVTVPEQEG